MSVVAKRASRTEAERAARERRQARIGLASNVLGLTAGTVGLGSAMRDDRLRHKKAGTIPRGLGKLGDKMPTPLADKIDKMPPGKAAKISGALATGAVGLQILNLAGDGVANRVLARSAEEEPVKKSGDSHANADAYWGHGLSQPTRGVNLESVEKAFWHKKTPYEQRTNSEKAEYHRKRERRAKQSSTMSYTNTGVQGLASARNINDGNAGWGVLHGGAAVANYQGAKIASKQAAYHRKMADHFENMALTEAENMGAVEKAYRRYDPEADRQRRLGLYAGLGALGAGAGLMGARGEMERDLRTKGKRVAGAGKDVRSGSRPIRGLAFKPGHGRRGGLMLAAGAGSGLLGMNAYRRGIEERNAPWN